MKLNLLLPFFLYLGFSSQAQPEIEFLNTTFDFDTIFQYSDGRLQFEFKNIGDEPLIIKNGKTGDGGLGPPYYSKDPIPPGASGIITGRYDTKRVGKFSKRFTIFSNSQKNERIALKIIGVVKLNDTKIKIHPPNEISQEENNNVNTYQVIEKNDAVVLKCNLGKLDLGELKTTYFNIENIGEYPLWLTSIDPYCNNDIPTSYLFFGENPDFPNFFDGDFYFNKQKEAFLKKPTYHRSNEKWELQRSLQKGESGYLKFLFFNHKGNLGIFQETIFLNSNTKKQYRLEITGEFINSTNEKTITFEHGNKQYVKKYFKQGQIHKIEYIERKNKIKEQTFSLKKF